MLPPSYRRRKAVPEPLRLKRPLDRLSIGTSANFLQATIQRGFPVCAYIVPIQQAVRSSHAKRKSYSLVAPSRTRCLGVPLERILLRTNEKASQNRYRDA